MALCGSEVRDLTVTQLSEEKSEPDLKAQQESFAPTRVVYLTKTFSGHTKKQSRYCVMIMVFS